MKRNELNYGAVYLTEDNKPCVLEKEKQGLVFTEGADGRVFVGVRILTTNSLTRQFLHFTPIKTLKLANKIEVS